MNLQTIHGDCLRELRKLPAQSVHTCITSPPYWGLRSYPIPPTVWGGDDECAHKWGEVISAEPQKPQTGLKDAADAGAPRKEKRKKNRDTDGEVERPDNHGRFCATCGAWEGQLGLEPTPELYVSHVVQIFDEVWRVLRDDGTCWVNLGDVYHTGNGGAGRQGTENAQRVGRTHTQPNLKARLRIEGRKPSDLIGVPWLVAFAMQRSGWYLRKDNIWAKGNCMPESLMGWQWEQCRVKVSSGYTKDRPHPNQMRDGKTKLLHNSGGVNLAAAKFKKCPGCEKCAPNQGLVLRRGAWRCTTNHEYFFQFSKQEEYFCDGMAAQVPVTGTANPRGTGVNPKAAGPKGLKHGKQNASFSASVSSLLSSTRNMRSVWKVNSKPYKGSHTATFPPELIRPLVRIASPKFCCSACGAPWVPHVVRGKPNRALQKKCGGDKEGAYKGKDTKDRKDGSQSASDVKRRILEGMTEKKVEGYLPICACGAPRKNSVIIDPFGGSGTVGSVGIEEGRDVILIEIGDEYIPQIRTRTTNLQTRLL